jgi:Tetratricopeptide repeat
MSGFSSTARNLLFTACCAVSAACTTFGSTSSRPSLPPAARPQPPAATSSATPPPAPPSSAPGSTTVEPPSLPNFPPGIVTPPRPHNDASSASSALLAQSRAERASGSFAQATASIERALRLDPNNAELWVERGELALQTGNAAQAGAMARKALSLAGGNSLVAARAQRLLQTAGAH